MGNHPFEGRAGSRLRNHLLNNIIGPRDGWTCKMCGKAPLYPGRTAHNSAVIDHIKPWKLRPDLMRDPENMQLVCKQCHDTTCAIIEARNPGDADAIAQEKMTGRSALYDEAGRPIW